MIRQHAIPARAHIGNAQHIHEIFAELKRPRREGLGARQPLGIVREQFGIVDANRMDARPRRRDDIGQDFRSLRRLRKSVTLEHLDHVFRDLARVRPKSRVEQGLSATGLVARKVHGYAQAGENIQDGLAHFGVERVHETGREELDGRHGSILP